MKQYTRQGAGIPMPEFISSPAPSWPQDEVLVLGFFMMLIT